MFKCDNCGLTADEPFDRCEQCGVPDQCYEVEACQHRDDGRGRCIDCEEFI